MKDEFSDFTPLFYRIFRKKMGNRGKDSIWELRVLSTCSMNAQNLPFFFLKFTDQMENRGEDGIWELRVLATFGPNSQNSPRFSGIH